MEQNNISRENFWDRSGEGNKEIADLLYEFNVSSNGEWTMGDEWLTLFCC